MKVDRLRFVLTVATLAVVLTFSSVSAAPEEPRWFFSSGVSVRALTPSFKLGYSHHESLDWGDLFPRRPNVGSLTTFDGTGKPRVYRNGAVGGDNPNFTGFGAEGRVDDPGQIRPLAPGADANGNLARTLSFSSTGYSYPSNVGVSQMSPATTANPSLELGYHLGSLEGTDIRVDFVSGWTFLQSGTNTGHVRVAEVFEARTEYTFLYDYVADPSLPLAIPGTIDGFEQFIVYNPTAVPAFFGTGYRSPKTLTDTTRASSPSFYAVGRADLEVSLNEIPFGLRFTREAGPVDLSWEGGLTFNILQYNLKSQLAWYEAGRTAPAFQHSWQDSGTPFKLGLFTGLAARLPLTPDGRVFLETRGSYRWVDPVTVSAGMANVEIDASSWEGRAGFGFTFE